MKFSKIISIILIFSASLNAMEPKYLDQTGLSSITDSDECPVCFSSLDELGIDQACITKCCRQFICKNDAERLENAQCPMCRNYPLITEPMPRSRLAAVRTQIEKDEALAKQIEQEDIAARVQAEQRARAREEEMQTLVRQQVASNKPLSVSPVSSSRPRIPSGPDMTVDKEGELLRSKASDQSQFPDCRDISTSTQSKQRARENNPDLTVKGHSINSLTLASEAVAHNNNKPLPVPPVSSTGLTISGGTAMTFEKDRELLRTDACDKSQHSPESSAPPKSPLEQKMLEKREAIEPEEITDRTVAQTKQQASEEKNIIERGTASEMLYGSILNDSAEGIMQAIDAGADVNLRIGDKSPLMLAILLRRLTAFEVLLNAGANIAAEAQNLVEIAIKLGDFRPVRMLLERGVIESTFSYPDSQNRGFHLNLITPAIRLGDVRSAIYLLGRGIGFAGRSYENRWGRTIMDEIYLLLNRQVANADIPLELILELIQEIINHGYFVDNIWYCGLSGQNRHKLIYQIPQILEIFLRNGANPNHVMDINNPHKVSGGVFTWTPLLRAIEAGERAAVQILLDAGADINFNANPISRMGSVSPLTFAIECGNAEIVELLIQRGAGF